MSKTLMFKSDPSIRIVVKAGHAFPSTRAIELVSARLMGIYEHPYQLSLRIENTENEYDALMREARELREEALELARAGSSIHLGYLDCVIARAERKEAKLRGLYDMYEDAARMLVDAGLEQNWVEVVSAHAPEPVEWRPVYEGSAPSTRAPRKEVFRRHTGEDTRRPNPAAMRGVKPATLDILAQQGLVPVGLRYRPLLGGHTSRKLVEPCLDTTPRSAVRQALREGKDIPTKKQYAD